MLQNTSSTIFDRDRSTLMLFLSPSLSTNPTINTISAEIYNMIHKFDLHSETDRKLVLSNKIKPR